MKIGSLFSGIGGLELGLEWAGVGHTVWQVEREPFCQEVLAKHWPDAKRYDDVCTVGAHNLEPVDVICGGFPCQDISYAGKGAGLAGARSGLWYEFARIIGEMGPRYVVVENVRAILTRGLDQVLGTLADLGYDAEWSSFSAKAVGALHKRERTFILAYAMRHGRDDGSGENEGAGARTGKRNSTSREMPEPRSRGAFMAGGVLHGSRWAAEPAVGRMADGVPATVDRLAGLGNCVVPQVATVVGRRLLQIARP